MRVTFCVFRIQQVADWVGSIQSSVFKLLVIRCVPFLFYFVIILLKWGISCEERLENFLFFLHPFLIL